VKRRAAVAIPTFETVSTNRGSWEQSEEDPFPGYPDGVPYASVPRTSYQARARQGIAEDADVQLHYTARFSESVVERYVCPTTALFGRADVCSYGDDDDDDRVCNVAIMPGADWRSLPEALSIGKDPSERKARDVRYSRIDGSGHFRTAMTTVTPSAQGTTVIHPTVRPVPSPCMGTRVHN
jgi:DNA (cytosine-5)-methyltransferase 1